MLKFDIISHNIPGGGFRKNDNLSNSDFIVYTKQDRFRVYFLKYDFKTICHIVNKILELDDKSDDTSDTSKDNKLLKMIYGPKHKLLHVEIVDLSMSDFLKLVIDKKN